MKIAFFELSKSQESFFKNHVKNATLITSEQIVPATIPGSLHDIDILSIFVHSAITEATLAQLSKLKVIITRSTGYDHIDTKACKRRNITVISLPTYATTAVAEYTFALLLRCMRYICSEKIEQGSELAGKKLGIIGTGRIGKDVARIAHGFSMDTCAYDICKDEECATQYDVSYCSLEHLFKNSDIITIHTPLLPETHHLINANAFNQVKKGVIIINAARGEIIDSHALLQALDSNIVSYALLDVVEKKFVRQFEQHQRVIFTHHNAYNTKESEERMLHETAAILQKIVDAK
jgi:D-lactate dehydrogenase